MQNEEEKHSESSNERKPTVGVDLERFERMWPGYWDNIRRINRENLKRANAR